MKYKEYWITFKPWIVDSFGEAENVMRYVASFPHEHGRHVIEYQALIDEAKAHKATASVLQSEIEKLQKQNEKLKNGLSYYCAHQLYKPIIGMKLDEKTSKLIYEMGSIARKTLEELDNDPAS